MDARKILMGVVGRPHGVRGLCRVVSYADDLTAYDRFEDERGQAFALRRVREDVFEVFRLADGGRVAIADRDAAAKLTNTKLYVDRDRLPPPDEDEFYLADLVGMAALDESGRPVGSVCTVHDYGAGASLEIARDAAAPLLVPFTRASVPQVDVAGRRLTVVPPTEASA